jgi:superfamily II DNA/RNA helicase
VSSEIFSSSPAPPDEPAPPPSGLPDAFLALGLSEAVVRAVAELGYTTPTPIQEQAIPFVLAGRDVLGCAQTGTGKTASFTLPMLDILSGTRARARMPRSLILEPTRELALQVAENFVQYGKYLKLTHALIIGGESLTDQRDLLARGVDVLIATPGRLLDVFERGGVLLHDTRILVIDEADRMLDMGFIPDVERIVKLLPARRQTLLFSATMVPEIRRIADAFLDNPKEITVAPPASVASTITAALVLVAEHDKREALRRLLRREEIQNALIFCNRKRDVAILHRSLLKHGFNAGALHGDMPQTQRFSMLEKFRSGEIRLLVCSDVAARGLDISGVSHVFNFDVPRNPEDYVHRIGRTGRAGRAGKAFTLALPSERLAVEAIEKLTGQVIPRLELEGLDPVTWEEEVSPKRRGRKGKERGAAPPPPPATPAAESEGAPASRPSRRQKKRRSGETPSPLSAPAAAPQPSAPPPRGREEERVLGFGTAIPAFFLRPGWARSRPLFPSAPLVRAEEEAARERAEPRHPASASLSSAEEPAPSPPAPSASSPAPTEPSPLAEPSPETEAKTPPSFAPEDEAGAQRAEEGNIRGQDMRGEKDTSGRPEETSSETQRENAKEDVP